jgi:C1A family cysteine protease
MYPLYAKVQLPELEQPLGTGWLPPLPDMRDYTVETPQIAELSLKLGFRPDVEKLKMPTSVDLKADCSGIENQGGLGSCTANAAVGIVEYFERRAFGRHIDGSRLFVYKTTRNLLGVTGDTGAWLRNTIGALVLCGVPAERYWPYTDKAPDFDAEPSSFVYAVADNYETVFHPCSVSLDFPPSRPQTLPDTFLILAQLNALNGDTPSWQLAMMTRRRSPIRAATGRRPEHC